MDVFECSICLEEFKQPVVLSCGHTFCKGCLLKVRDYQCPTCRQFFYCDVDSLPSNFVVLQWMEENKKNTEKNKKKSNSIECENCETQRQAVVWCENCSPGTYYCQVCDTSVHSGKATRSHVRMSINQKKKTKPHFSKCEKHMEESKYYCLNCKIFICIVCYVDDHPQHKTISSYKYAEKIKTNLKNTLSNIVESIDILETKEKKYELYIKNLEIERVKLTKKLKETEEDLKKKKLEREKDIKQLKNIETSHLVLKNSIDEMGVMELMNKDSIELMINRIKKIDDELCPAEVKLQAKKTSDYSYSHVIDVKDSSDSDDMDYKRKTINRSFLLRKT
jgi:hypothetical protein